MKRTVPILLVITACLAAITSFSQNATDDKKNKTCKVQVMTTNTDDDSSTSISKVMTVDENGKKKLVITTTKNGETTVEKLTGEEAEKYMAENSTEVDKHANALLMMKSNGDVEMDIDMEQLMKEAGVEISEGENGEKKVIFKSCNGSNYSYNYNFDSDENDAHKVIVKAYTTDGEPDDKNATIIKDKRVYNDVEDIEKLLEELGVEMDDKADLTDGKKRVIVKKIVRIEDIDAEDSSSDESKELKETPALFSAYPNPTNGQFTIELANSSKNPVSITVTDSNGKLVHKQKIKGEGKQAATVNLNKAKKGVYFITVTKGEETSTQKIMVE